uniref:Transforming growth factor beta 1 induced transcript 1 n=1 Tax=Laticauda laticaudata TaxID=8630 RepID=A0A8C5SXV5_LATLA
MGAANVAQGTEEEWGEERGAWRHLASLGGFAQILWPQSRASIKRRGPINSCHPFLSIFPEEAGTASLSSRCAVNFRLPSLLLAFLEGLPPSPLQPLTLASFASHLSTVCKPLSPKAKEAAPPPFSSSSGVLGAGLCELDRLLQELNATQFNITDEIMSQFPSSKSPATDKDKERLEDSTDGTSLSRSTTSPSAKPTATSATLELDKLMASLSDFRVQSNLPGVSVPTTTVTTTTTVPPAPAPAQVPSAQQPVVSSVCPGPTVLSPQMSPGQPSGNLDSMLVMLESDLSRQGISTTAKGLCASCQKPIAGQVVTALGSTWHPEHFVCTYCQKEMGGSNFFEKDGAPYCERDYFQLFSPRCGFCNEPILDKMVTALDKNWHPEHFCCVKCRRPFGEEGFHEKDGKQYCRQDFYELFSTRCQGCSQAILENYISALNALWHPECFVCRVSISSGPGLDCVQSCQDG